MKLIILYSFVIIFLLRGIFASSIENASSITSEPECDRVVIKVYYETLCPYSRQFLSDILKPTVLRLKKHITVKLYPYGKANTTKVDHHYEFHCQHGPKECYGNKLHDCALKYIGSITEVVLFDACMVSRQGVGSDDEGADACGQSLGIPTDRIKQCAKTAEGDKLHKYYGDESKKAKFHYVPYVLVNDVEWTQTDNAEEFIRDVCKAFKITPIECKC